MRLFPKFLSTMAIAGAAAAATPIAASAAAVTCAIYTDTQIVTAAGGTTSSQIPVDLPGATFTRTFSNPAPACVLVEFSGQVRAQSPKAVRIKVTLLGSPNSPAFPATVDFSTSGAGADGRYAVFVFPVLQGNYTVKIQFQSLNGTPVSITKGVMRIHFNNES